MNHWHVDLVLSSRYPILVIPSPASPASSLPLPPDERLFMFIKLVGGGIKKIQAAKKEMKTNSQLVN